MDLHEALYTTRAMRRVTDQPVPDEIRAKILDAAIRAPTGGNAQNWRFVMVDDPELIGRIAPVYRRCLDELWTGFYADRVAAAKAEPDSSSSRDFRRMQRSADWLGDNFAIVPLLLFGFIQHDPTGGSIYPAVWSAQLAARAEGVGSSLTSVLMFAGDEVPDLLEVPRDEGWIMACCVTFGYPTGRWGVPGRRPAHEVAGLNSWTGPMGFEVPDPLWAPD